MNALGDARPDLVSSSRTLCAARSTSAGRSASTSDTRSPDRYSSVSSARFRIPVGALTRHPLLGAVLVTADVLAPLAVGLILVAMALAGSDRTVERVFRLLRWIAGRPEPPAPGDH